jgi:hypothetical protein
MSEPPLPGWIADGCERPYPLSVRVFGSFVLAFFAAAFLAATPLVPKAYKGLTWLAVLVGASVALFRRSASWHELLPSCRWRDEYRLLRADPQTSHAEAVRLLRLQRDVERLQRQNQQLQRNALARRLS